MQHLSCGARLVAYPRVVRGFHAGIMIATIGGAMLTKERIQAIRQEHKRIVKASALSWIGRCFVKAMLEMYILMWRLGFCLRANPFWHSEFP